MQLVVMFIFDTVASISNRVALGSTPSNRKPCESKAGAGSIANQQFKLIASRSGNPKNLCSRILVSEVNATVKSCKSSDTVNSFLLSKPAHARRVEVKTVLLDANDYRTLTQNGTFTYQNH